MVLLGIFLAIVILSYTVLLWRLYHRWVQILSTAYLPIDHERQYPSVTVIIPVRNEAPHIQACILSILDNDLENVEYEVLVINDHSTDDTAYIVQELHHPKVRITNVPQHITGKKSALHWAITHEATGEVIICTDGDVIVNTLWIKSHLAYYPYQGKPWMCTGIVDMLGSSSLITKYQALDMIGTMPLTYFGIDTAHFYLANGANMAFKKSSFLEAGGFTEGNSFSSGDDIWLINSIAKLDDAQINFNSNPLGNVSTHALTTFNSLLSQRKRWATKSLYVPSKKLKQIQLLIFSVPFLGLTCLLFSIFFESPFWLWGLSIIAAKTLVDTIYLYCLINKKQPNPEITLFQIIKSQPYHLLILIYSGLSAIFPSHYVWKDRYLH